MSFSKKITDLKREVLKESEPLFAHIEDVLIMIVQEEP